MRIMGVATRGEGSLELAIEPSPGQGEFRINALGVAGVNFFYLHGGPFFI